MKIYKQFTFPFGDHEEYILDTVTPNYSEVVLDCSPEDMAAASDNYIYSRKVRLIFDLTITLAALYLNTKLLISACKYEKRQGLLYPKLILLALYNFVTQFTMILNSIEYLLCASGVEMDSEVMTGIFCKLTNYLYIVAVFTISWIVAISAVQRYVAIKYPLTVIRYSKQLLRVEVSSVVIVPLIFISPKLITTGNYMIGDYILVCLTRTDHPGLYAFDAFYSAFLYGMSTIVPVFVLIVFTILLVLQVDAARRRSSRLMDRMQETSSAGANVSFRLSATQFMHGTIMTLVLAATYTILQLPDVFVWILDHALRKTDSSVCQQISAQTLYSYCKLLRGLVAITNPAIFLVFRWYSEKVAKRMRSEHGIIHISTISLRTPYSVTTT